MRILLLASHGIAEYDDIRMFHHLGYEVFCPGGYANPAEPGETLRPALPEVPYHADLARMCEIQRGVHREPPGRRIDWAKADLHPGLVDWAEVIIVHHFPIVWIGEQWQRIRHKRVIWRTCGQSDPGTEAYMSQFRGGQFGGLQIVRYSPAEERYFTSLNPATIGVTTAWAGQDALIRFGKFPGDYGPWIGDDPVVGNVTQNMVDRGDATGLTFYLEATQGLPAKPAGPGSEKLPGGIGALGYDEMREYLRHLRAYLYTGTAPASYTLGLIEAMLSGVPVVSIGPEAWDGPDELFEGHEITGGPIENTPALARSSLALLLERPDIAQREGAACREHAVDLFGIDTVGPQWRDFLGAPKVDKATPVGAWDGVL